MSSERSVPPEISLSDISDVSDVDSEEDRFLPRPSTNHLHDQEPNSRPSSPAENISLSLTNDGSHLRPPSPEIRTPVSTVDSDIPEAPESLSDELGQSRYLGSSRTGFSLLSTRFRSSTPSREPFLNEDNDFRGPNKLWYQCRPTSLIISLISVIVGVVLCAAIITGSIILLKPQLLQFNNTSFNDTSTAHSKNLGILLKNMSTAQTKFNFESELGVKNSKSEVLNILNNIFFDADAQELLFSYFNKQRQRLISLALDANSLTIVAEDISSSVHPYHQCKTCSQRSRDIYCCSSHCISQPESYCVGTLINATQEFRYSVSDPVISGSWRSSKTSFLFITQADGRYAVNDFWRKKSTTLELSYPFPKDVAPRNVDMPSESRLDILGHADDSSYTIVTYRRTARKFVWDKTSVLVGGNGYTSHSTLCSDSRITYHAVLSYNSDDSSQELRWILEIFSPTTLERKYYSSDTTEDASANVVELVCIDSRTVVVFVAQSSVVTSELVIIKYMFTL